MGSKASKSSRVRALGEIGEDPAQVMMRSRPQALAASMRPYRLAEAWAPVTVSWKSQSDDYRKLSIIVDNNFQETMRWQRACKANA